MTRPVGRFEKNCPCKQDCANRSTECRKTCPEWAVYEAMKAEEYEHRKRVSEYYYNRREPTAASKSAQRRHEKAAQRGRCHWR